MLQRAHEQARADEGFGQLPRRLVGERRPGHALRADRFAVGLHHHEQGEDLVEARARRRRQAGEHFLGTMRERANQAANLAIAAEGQLAGLGAPLVQGVQRVLQQRQRIDVLQRRIAQGVVQTRRAVGVVLEHQAGEHRGRPDDLRNLAGTRGEHVNMAITGFEFGQTRHGGDQARIEVAARNHHHRHVRAIAQLRQHAPERGPLALIDRRRSDQRLAVVENQQQMRIRRQRRNAPAHRLGDYRAHPFGLLAQHGGEIGDRAGRKHRASVDRPTRQRCGQLQQHVATVAAGQIAIRHRQRLQAIETAFALQQWLGAGTQQRGLAATAGPDQQHEPALAVDLSTQCGQQFCGHPAAPEEHLGMAIVEGAEPDVRVAVRPRPGNHRRAPIVVRKQHLGDQAIAALADRLDVGRVAAAVADQAAQVCDRTMHRVVAVKRATPDLDQQLIGADHLAGMFGECNQHFHQARLKRNLAFTDDQGEALGHDQQRADAELAHRGQ